MWLKESAETAKDLISANAPAGVAASMGQGIKNNIGISYDRKGSAEIKPNSSVASYADAVETGSRPHRPPMGPNSALAQWCEMKGLNVWAVAKSIEKKGTKAHPYIEPAYRELQYTIPQKFSQGVSQYIERMVKL